jgi:hypothetical protein
MKIVPVLSILSLLVGVHARAQSISQTQSDDPNLTSYSDELMTRPGAPHTAPTAPHHPAPPSHPAPSPAHGPSPINHGGNVGWHDGGPRPGWKSGWTYDRGQRPNWWNVGLIFPAFAFAADLAHGDWQCTAFDQAQNPYSAAADNQEEAQYNALYDCGGQNYAQDCYIPDGYCNQDL